MRVYGLLHKYKNAPITLKATIWYTICNMLQKIAAFLIIPFLTRILTTADYGYYTVFLSWLEIIEIFATMRMYSNGYVAGLIKYSEEEESYTCSVQFVTLITIVLCFAIFYSFADQVSNFLQIENKLICYMFFSFFATSSVGIWSSRQRVKNRYIMMVLITFFYSVLAPIASIIGAYLSDDKLEKVIEIRILTQFIISIPFFLMNILGRNKSVVWKYCKGALAYNIPLVPYYLSMVVLNSSDRIMIKNIVGEAEAGIYGVAYSLSMVTSVFVGAVNLSLQPWVFNKLRANTPGNASRVMGCITCFIALMNLCVLVISPELIRIIASEKYVDAVWVMPPIVCSSLIMFIYQQFLNIHFYFVKTNIVFIASIIAAVSNIVLNYVFINLVGYIAAGYTTLISYFLIMIMYYLTMKKIAANESVDYRKYFNIPLIIGVMFIFACITVSITILYPYPGIRYIMIIVASFVLFFCRKKFFSLVRNIRWHA